MARSSSGRIVVAVDPVLKRELYSALAAEGISLKDWFIKSATYYISERKRINQPVHDAQLASAVLGLKKKVDNYEGPHKESFGS